MLPVDAKVKECLGDYRVVGTEPPETIKIELQEDKLYVTSPALPFRTRLYPVGPDTFKIFENGEELTLLRDGSRVAGLRSNFAQRADHQGVSVLLVFLVSLM